MSKNNNDFKDILKNSQNRTKVFVNLITGKEKRGHLPLSLLKPVDFSNNEKCLRDA